MFLYAGVYCIWVENELTICNSWPPSWNYQLKLIAGSLGKLGPGLSSKWPIRTELTTGHFAYHLHKPLTNWFLCISQCNSVVSSLKYYMHLCNSFWVDDKLYFWKGLDGGAEFSVKFSAISQLWVKISAPLFKFWGSQTSPTGQKRVTSQLVLYYNNYQLPSDFCFRNGWQTVVTRRSWMVLYLHTQESLKRKK